MTKFADPPPDADGPSLGSGLQAMLGEQLRRIYGTTLSEPIPDRFMALMNALDRPAPAVDTSGEPSSSAAPVGDEIR